MKYLTAFLLITSLSLQPATGAGNDPVTMGAAKVNITPEEPVMMSGYEARKTPSTGVHDELFATALCFSDSRTKVLIITSDVIGFSHELADAINQEISSTTGISADHILLTAAHNHGGPSLRTYSDEVPAANERYIQSIKEKLVQASVEASRNLQPVRLGTGSGRCTMNINRRAKFADGDIWLGRNQDGPCDHEVMVLKMEDGEGNLEALHINWPCHGTTNGQDNYKITADWPGAATGYLEDTLTDGVIIGVTSGASGDINPIYGPGNNFREIAAIGFNLGEEVMRILPGIETQPAYQISALQRTILLPGKKPADTHFPLEEYEEGPDTEIRLSAIKVGNIVFAGISGEVMTEIGMKIKADSPYSGTVVVTHCNGSSGYICTDQAFKEGGYEVKVSRLMPGAEEVILQQFTEMINLL